ncbi:DUF6600 domain-containing protein [Paraburkholderia acidipaludis]|uniref:DUF6600 domain-containing protein n=1 Tax=Paraburkholderia acidipaludis TaxID=660537 RepID=UPI000487D38F|nr:DUF6600 domain-containing protein [Paraburkholderia acidipaludis]
MKERTPTHLSFRRLTGHTLIACAALAALNLAAAPAFAQSAPPPDASAQEGANVDPPGRVARLDYMAGAVTTEPAGTTDWSYAQVNRPLTTGDQLWNDANARSELHIGSTAVRMGAQTSLDILNLSDNAAQLKVAQGTLSTRVRELPAGTTYEIDTPNLALGVNQPGDYRVDVAPDGSSTTVTVRSGSVTVYGENGQIPMSAGQQIQFGGTSLQETASNAAPPPDAFDQWALARDEAEDRSISARYVSRDMPGYEDLDANGSWRENPQYGEVWVPNAEPAGWAPYHDGHWVWQAPWGWTWVDDAPWGFAPYHYGRWAYVDDSWAWVPGPLVESAPPVYAPALVAFVGGGGGGVNWGVDLTVGGVAAAGVAWFALGPGEPWHPGWGGWSPHYYQRVNQTVVVNNVHVTNITNVNVHNTFVNYRVPGAVTAVPATDFVHGQPVARFAQRVDPQQWRNARIESGTPGIAPVRGSFGGALQRANYRPPAALQARQVVATRAAVTPPAFHDTLAQRFAHEGGAVPGAGAPVVRVSAPAHAPLEAAHGGWAPQNVRVVPPHSPVMREAERPAGAAPQPGRPGGMAAGAPAPERGQPNMANAREPVQEAHGVPHPPQAGGRPEGGAPNAPGQAEAHQPVWTQPHAPMATRGEPGNGAGRPAQPEAREAANVREPQGQPQRGFEQAPEARPQAPQQAREESRPQPQAQPRPEPAQARAEYHPQPQPQQRPENRPQPEQHAEARPQPQQRAEPRPQPQPHAEPRPAPHPDEHANRGHDDHQHG